MNDGCMYLSYNYNRNTRKCCCAYPENVIIIPKTNWFGVKIKYKYKRKPQDINKNKDCNWFSTRWK